MKFANPVNPRNRSFKLLQTCYLIFGVAAAKRKLIFFCAATIFRSAAALILRFFLGSGVLFQPIGGALSKLTGSHAEGNPKTIHEASAEFVTTYGYDLNAQIVVEMAGSEQLTKALRELTKTIMKAHGHIETKQFGIVMSAMVEFSSANETFMNACRRELGF